MKLLLNSPSKLPRLLLQTLTVALLASGASAWAQKVRLATSVGDIVLELDAEKAPKTTANFLQYVRDGHYNGLIFHRVINGFMVQGGGYKADLSEKPTRKPIPLESGNGLSNLRGSIAMARTNDPNSATAQFFINVADNLRLDKAEGRDGYAVFGKVVEGMEVVDKIKEMPTRAEGMQQNLPVTPVTLSKATVEK